MPRKAEQIAQSKKPIGESAPTTTLRGEVKESLLSILRDSSASAAAKASAGRTILEYFSDSESASSKRRGAEMSARELDDEIAKLGD